MDMSSIVPTFRARPAGLRASRGLLVLLALATQGAAGAASECKLAELLTIPVTLDGSKPTLPAKVNGTDVNLVLDTGAWISAMSRNAVRRLKLPTAPLPVEFEMRGIGGVTDDSEMATVDELKLGDSRVHNITFVSTDDLFGDRAVGLLGQNVLGDLDLDYDLATGTIRLMYADKACRDSPLAYWAGDKPYSVIDLAGGDKQVTVTGSSRVRRTAAGHTMVIVLVNGKRVKTILDSGAGLSMIDTEAARGAGVTRDSPGVKSGGYSYGLGRGRVETWVAPFDSFQIGDEKITHTHLRVGDLKGLGADMLLGADFFLSHRIYVSNLQHRMYFTYNGGHVFDLKPSHDEPAAAAAGGPEPADADGYSRRGMALAARGNLEAARSDLDKACELAPAESRYFALRADVRWKSGDGEGAKADYDQALELKPQAQDFRLNRAELLIELKNVDGALADLGAAAAAIPAESADTLRIAHLYSRAGRHEAAVAQYTRWIDARTEERLLPTALNGRCWSRALLGRELQAGLEDCNKAVSLSDGAPGAHGSRGLVELRLARYDDAIEDYDAALKKGPDGPWSLYGRGLAKLKKGRAAEGQADIDAAKAADPKIAEEAGKYGIVP